MSARMTTFCVVTLLWLLLGGMRFYGQIKETQKTGGPLQDVQIHVAEKVALASRAPALADYTELMARQMDLASLYASRFEGPDGDLARCRYAALLLAIGQPAEATKQLAAVQSTKVAALVSALIDAAAGGAANLPPTQLDRDLTAVDAALSGWVAQAVKAILYERAGRQEQTLGLRAWVQAEAERAASGLATIVAVMAFDFVAGIVVIVVFLAIGRDLDLRPKGIEVEPSWDPVAGWSLLVAWQVVSIGVALVNAKLLGGELRGAPPGVFVMQLVIYGVLMALIGWVIRGRWADIGVHLVSWQRNLLVGLCGAWMALIFVLATQFIASKLSGQSGPSSNPVFQLLRDESSGFGLVLMFVLVAIVGPIFEEILFRGVIYGSMKQVMPVALAIPLCGAVFSLAHGDVNALVPLLVLGSLLSFIFERTRSVVASSLTHCIWNGQVFLVAVFLFS